ncbi:hypothetical protein [Flintibacter muris]|uniref:hypothetical protein n=1 Tax=Flintibacter muris TaxID=2941327 RepID=UPI00203D7B7D|nr:hypothetical protein [Flintibacter muris]
MKHPKSLTREQYLKQFSRAVRWRLPPQESEDTIADYRELIFQPERDESKLVEELGAPVQAAHLLTDVKTYRRWLAVFAVLAFGLFLLAKWAWTGMTVTTGFFSYSNVWYPVWVMAAGLLLSLYWFRRHGQKSGIVSKWLILALAVVLIMGCGVLYEIWNVTGIPIYEQLTSHTSRHRQDVILLITAMMYIGVFSALAALVGLVLARCQDRRWLALYILGLTVAAMIGFVTFNMKRMDLSMPDAHEFRTYLFIQLSLMGTAGLIGTGVALC